MTIAVVLADDQAVVRAGLRTILEAEPDIDVVGEAGDGGQAVRVARTLQPDVVLMDVRMPHVDGIAATRELAGPNAADPITVLMLTTFDLDEYVFDALRAGASGFLLKNIEPDELVMAVRVVAEGQGLVAREVTLRLITEFAHTSSAAAPPPVFHELTDREREILPLVARGWSNAEIAQHLVLSRSTVKTHVANTLAKLGCRDRVQMVVFAYEHGLVRPGGSG
jgi:DNA-binding NarL/FixJ family response regulator